jgi:2-(1,2-epoxy-1,2-dihydrophenyl)acetyl-CoA isomerase
MKYDNLICERREAVLTVTLNRPEKMNSLSRGLLRDLRRCAEDLSQDQTLRAVLLTGSGRAFCAGADLTDPDEVPRLGESVGQWVGARLRSQFNPVVELWSQLPVPLVVAVNGIAAGAGVSLALLGDVTIAARSSSFAVLFTPKLGLAPDMGATHLLPARIGVARARYLALTGRPVAAEEAVRIGLIAEYVDDAALGSRAAELAAELAVGPTRAQLALRDLLDHGASRPLVEQLEREAVVQQSLADTRDFQEGVAAFQQKRAPRFQGA